MLDHLQVYSHPLTRFIKTPSSVITAVICHIERRLKPLTPFKAVNTVKITLNQCHVPLDKTVKQGYF